MFNPKILLSQRFYIYSSLCHSFLLLFAPASYLPFLGHGIYCFICFSQLFDLFQELTVSDNLLIEKFWPPWRNAKLNRRDKLFVLLSFFSTIKFIFLIQYFFISTFYFGLVQTEWEQYFYCVFHIYFQFFLSKHNPSEIFSVGYRPCVVPKLTLAC